MKGLITYKKKDYNKYKLHKNKHSEEEFLIERAVKRIIQILYDKGFFYNFDKIDEVLKKTIQLLEDVDLIYWT